MEKLLLFIVIQYFWTNILTAHSLPRVDLPKCCKDNEVFSSSHKCVPRDNGQRQERTVKVTDLTNEITVHSLNLNYTANSSACGEFHKIFFQFKILIFGGHRIVLIDTYNNNKHMLYDNLNICVDFVNLNKNSEDLLIAQQCLQCPEDNPCVNFCCNEQRKKETEERRIFDSSFQSSKFKKFVSSDNYTQVNTELGCEETQNYPRHLWRITQQGMIINGDQYELNNYCIERTENVVMVCQNKKPRDDITTAKLIVMSISILCIIIIIACNCASDELRNTHVTAIKMPFLFFLALSFLIVVVRSKLHASLVSHTGACVMAGLLLQFSALSIFFWLTCFR